MSYEEELQALKSQLESLTGELAAKYATGERLTEVNSSIESLKTQIALSGRLGKVEVAHNSWKTLAKYLSITTGIVAVALSWLGYKSLDASIHAAVEKRFAFYSDLSSGLAYMDKEPDFAIPFLMRCFSEEPFEEPIIISLLYSSDSAVEWDVGQTVLERLNRDPIKLESFRNPMTYNNIAMAALNSAVGTPSFLEDAHRALDMGLRIAPPGNEALWYLRVNYWRYYMAMKDYANADAQIQYLKRLKPPPNAEPWEEIERWKWSQIVFSRDNQARSKAEQMWRSIAPQRSGTR
jgi:hypothetical protein